MKSQDLGKYGEARGVKYLEEKGFEILEKNYRNKHWEIDIIAKKGEKIHFVEVKTRRGTRFGEPIEAIGRDKINFLKKAANAYLESREEREVRYVQFDALGILVNPLDEADYKIDYVADLF